MEKGNSTKFAPDQETIINCCNNALRQSTTHLLFPELVGATQMCSMYARV